MTKLSDEFLYHLSRQDNLHPKSAEILADHGNSDVRKELAMNMSTPPHILNTLVDRHSGPSPMNNLILLNVARNPDAPSDALHKIINTKHLDTHSKSYAANHPNVNPDDTHKFYESVKGYHPDREIDYGEHINGYDLGPHDYKKDYHPETIQLIHEIVKKHLPSSAVQRTQIAEHPNTPHHVLSELRDWVNPRMTKQPSFTKELNDALNKRGIT